MSIIITYPSINCQQSKSSIKKADKKIEQRVQIELEQSLNLNKIFIYPLFVI